MRRTQGFIEVLDEYIKASFVLEGFEGDSIAVCDAIVDDSKGLEGLTRKPLFAKSTRCNMFFVKGREARLESRFLWDRPGVFHAPPALYRLPALLENPYRSLELLLVVDSKPSIEVYGLEELGSTVIASTKRTVLEGRQPPQLLIAGSNTSVEKAYGRPSEVVVKEPISLLYTYPVLSSDNIVDYAKLCEASRGYKMWGICLREAARIYHSMSVLSQLHAISVLGGFEPDILQVYGAGLRLLEHFALFQGIDVREAAMLFSRGFLPEEVASATRLSDKGVFVEVERIPARIGFIGSDEDSLWVGDYWFEAGRTRSIRVKNVSGLSLFCEKCWEAF
ncbi:MAG: hypothetical protein ABWW69_03545 [Pyrodictiaceae archaeon]